jgi:hypothetical protein
VPPLEGTISLGIYDAAGKLVRVLHREDTVNDFTEGHDALETNWDGTGDDGHPLPPGRYHARGYLVGDDVKVEGVDSYFNDWITDEDSPHIAHISALAVTGDSLRLTASTPDQKTAQYLFSGGKLQLTPTLPRDVRAPVDRSAILIDPVDWAAGKDGTVWAITHIARDNPEVEVVQLAPPGQTGPPILRHLPVAPDEPQPVAIAASPNENRIYLLEQSPALQRVRSLSLVASEAGQEEATSDWKVDFDKRIVAHQNFTLANGHPVIASPNDSPSPPATLPQKLRSNPLERDLPGRITLAPGFDADGSFLKSADGLPLRTISDTPDLTRVLLVRQAENAADVFQDDGAVVEQFRISHLDQMLAFDCGEFDLK